MVALAMKTRKSQEKETVVKTKKKGIVKKKVRMIENPMVEETGKEYTNKLKTKTKNSGLYSEIEIISKNKEEDSEEMVHIEEENDCTISRSIKDTLLALKLQAEERNIEIERLKEEGSVVKESEAQIEARLEKKLKHKLIEELHDSEERQDFFICAVNHKLERPFRGDFVFEGDKHYYDHIQILKSDMYVIFVLTFQRNPKLGCLQRNLLQSSLI